MGKFTEIALEVLSCIGACMLAFSISFFGAYGVMTAAVLVWHVVTR